METIHVVLATDENYAQHAGVMIASLLQNKTSPNPIVFHVLGNELSLDSCSKLEQISQKHNAAICFFDVNTEQVNSLSVSHHISKTTYLRLLIPDILSVKIEKVLYLDVDMVIRKDITELWDIDITAHHIGAVEHFRNQKNHSNWSYLKTPRNSLYFNAGLLLINMIRWRDDKTGLKAIDFIENNPDKIMWWDQDGLNALLWDKWLQLDRKWNVMEPCLQYYYSKKRNEIPEEFIESAKNPFIVHFTGSYKPWHYGYVNPYINEYYKYLDMTPWRGYRPKPQNIKSVLRKYWEIIKYKCGF